MPDFLNARFPAFAQTSNSFTPVPPLSQFPLTLCLQWRSTDPSPNSISEFRLNLYRYWSMEMELMKNDPAGRIEDLSGTEKIQLGEFFFPIIAASSHFLNTMR